MGIIQTTVALNTATGKIKKKNNVQANSFKREISVKWPPKRMKI
jgi:hypothetical protein